MQRGKWWMRGVLLNHSYAGFQNKSVRTDVSCMRPNVCCLQRCCSGSVVVNIYLVFFPWRTASTCQWISPTCKGKTASVARADGRPCLSICWFAKCDPPFPRDHTQSHHQHRQVTLWSLPKRWSQFFCTIYGKNTNKKQLIFPFLIS